MSEQSYPTSDEIERRLAPVLEELRQQTTYAQYDDPPTPPIVYREVVREKSVSKTVPSRRMLRDDFQLLREIAQHPAAGLSGHYKNIGWGVPRGQKALRHLLANNMITLNEEKISRPHGGRVPTIASLTDAGRQALEGYQRRSSPS